MDAIRRISPLRRVATMASLATLLLVPAHADAAKKKAKSPVIKSVSPMSAMVGQTLTIKGKNFRKGKGRNSVGFKREGAAVVFIKSDVSTKTTMYVKLSSKLEKVLYGGQPARFHLRVLAERFGRSYTANGKSPVIKPRPVVTTGPSGPSGPSGPAGPQDPAFDPAGPSGDCDGDLVLNKDESGDIDNDLLTDALEEKIGTDGCKADSDGDKVIDSYEYKSAVDLNDDQYQQPNTVLPYPGSRPYPNPLNADADKDFDGDSLTLGEEHSLWAKQGGRAKDETAESFKAKHLSYSDGLQYSAYELCPSGSNAASCGNADQNRHVPTIRAAGYSKQQAFLTWAAGEGYATVQLSNFDEVWWQHVNRGPIDIRDVNRDGSVSTGCPEGDQSELLYYDFNCDGFLSDDERDEDADGLTNYDESHGRILPGYWVSCYSQEAPYKVEYAGTDLADADSDGDGVRDGADDQDHDDLPNTMELSRMDASKGQTVGDVTYAHGLDDRDGGKQCKPDENLVAEDPNHPDNYGKVNPFDPCDPAINSRTCDRHPLIGAKVDPNWWSLQ